MHHLLYLFALLWGRLLIFKGETWPSIRRDGKARCWDTFGWGRFSSDQWTARGINCFNPEPFSPHTPSSFNHHFHPLRPPPVSHLKSLRGGQQRIHNSCSCGYTACMPTTSFRWACTEKSMHESMSITHSLVRLLFKPFLSVVLSSSSQTLKILISYSHTPDNKFRMKMSLTWVSRFTG